MRAVTSRSRHLRSILGRNQTGARFEEVPARPFAPTALRDAQHRTLVARKRVRGDVGTAVMQALELIAGDRKVLSAEDSPLLLPRFGSGPAPYSTASDFLEAVIHILQNQGCGLIRVLDARTETYPDPVNLREICYRTGCMVVDVRQGLWVRVQIGRGLGQVTIPRVAYESDRLVFLPSALANPETRFTMGLALAQELLHPDEHAVLRHVRREERLVELNLAVHPWLVLMDARKALVSDEGGGNVREPGYVLASGDPIALDVTAVKLLKGYPAKNRLDLTAWGFPQVSAAIALGLGAGREDDMRLADG